jgi:transcription elongation factor Elf1
MPRKDAYTIPNNQVRIFQREAKKLANGPYDCPRCGKKQLLVLIDNKNKQAALHCPSCTLEQILKYAPVFQGIDYYSKFIDEYKKSL